MGIYGDRLRILELLENDNGIYVGVKFDAETIEHLTAYQKEMGIPNPIDPAKFHTTIVCSTKHINWDAAEELDEIAKPDRIQVWDSNEKQCLVLIIKSKYLVKRFDFSMDEGAEYDFPDYIPHISLSYDVGDFDVSKMYVPDFDIVLDHEYVKHAKKD